MRAHASLRLGNVRGITPELLGSHRGSVCLRSVAPRGALGALVWPGKRDSPTRPPLLPLNAGTAEPVRVSPPEAVAYQLELLLADPGEFWLSASEQTADGLDEDRVGRPGLQTAGLLEGQDPFDPSVALNTGRALGPFAPEDAKP